MIEQEWMCAYSGLPSPAAYEDETAPDTNEALSGQDINRVIEMAWEDRTTFEAIERQFGLKEKEIIELMRKHSKRSSFKMWRKRMAGRKTKHQELRGAEVIRFKCSRQRLTGNKIAKR